MNSTGNSRTRMSLAALAALGAAAAIAVAAPTATVTGSVALATFETPMHPEQPADAAPTAGELKSVLNSVADPNVPAIQKGPFVQGGVDVGMAEIADGYFNEARDNGSFPLSFSVADIQTPEPGVADAAVTVTGPKLKSPYNHRVTFVNEEGWKISKASIFDIVSALDA